MAQQPYDRWGRLTAPLAHDSLKTLVEEQTTLDRVATVTRAAQAADHRAGWFLDIDERELRNGLIRFPPTKATPTYTGGFAPTGSQRAPRPWRSTLLEPPRLKSGPSPSMTPPNGT
jgi:hypothetical protein